MAIKPLLFKGLQWFLRGIEACCAIVVLALTCYFISTQDNRELPIHTWERAVAGISGAALVYFLVQFVLLWFIAGHPATSFPTMFLDVCFIGGFAYIAWANRSGTASCSDEYVDTPYGDGKPDWEISQHVGGNDGWTRLPTYLEACNMVRACLAVAILAIIFLAVSIAVEFGIIKARKEAKASHGITTTTTQGRGKGLLGFRRNKRAATDDSNKLPAHPTPSEARGDEQV